MSKIVACLTRNERYEKERTVFEKLSKSYNVDIFDDTRIHPNIIPMDYDTSDIWCLCISANISETQDFTLVLNGKDDTADPNSCWTLDDTVRFFNNNKFDNLKVVFLDAPNTNPFARAIERVEGFKDRVAVVYYNVMPDPKIASDLLEVFMIRLCNGYSIEVAEKFCLALTKSTFMFQIKGCKAQKFEKLPKRELDSNSNSNSNTISMKEIQSAITVPTSPNPVAPESPTKKKKSEAIIPQLPPIAASGGAAFTFSAPGTPTQSPQVGFELSFKKVLTGKIVSCLF